MLRLPVEPDSVHSQRLSIGQKNSSFCGRYASCIRCAQSRTLEPALPPGFTRTGAAQSSLSDTYMWNASPCCFRLLRQVMSLPLASAFASAGSSIATRSAMIPTTTRSSTKVKLRCLILYYFLFISPIQADLPKRTSSRESKRGSHISVRDRSAPWRAPGRRARRGRRCSPPPCGAV